MSSSLSKLVASCRLPSREVVRVYAPLLALILGLSIYTGQKNALFLSFNNYRNILLQTSVLGLLALGETFLIAAGQLDLSVAGEAALVSVISAWLLENHWSEAAVIVACIAIGCAIGLFWGLIVTVLRVPPFILTLGGLAVFRSLALRISHNAPISSATHFEWLNRLPVGVENSVLIVLIVLVLAILGMRYTRVGRQVYALGSSEEAAYLAGLPTARTKVMVFVISSTLAALAGIILVPQIGAGDPGAVSGYELQAVAAVVLGGGALAGGRGSPLGTYLGVLVLGVVASSIVFLSVDPSLTNLIFGAVLIFAVVSNALSDKRSGKTTKLRDSITRTLVPRLARRPEAQTPVTTMPTKTASIGDEPGETQELHEQGVAQP